MSLSLIGTEKAGTVKPRKKRERIQIMEVLPCDKWFQRSRDQWGREVWFMRVQITGLRTRRFGPFPTKHKGLLFLDRLLDEVDDAICNVVNDLGRYQVSARRFGTRAGHYPIVEDELCSR